MDYQGYRLRVLAKTNGRNVHKVNGLLGVIQNSEGNKEFWAKKGVTNSPCEHQEMIDQAAQQIFELTGVTKDY